MRSARFRFEENPEGEVDPVLDEHRGSRALDADFRAAAATGFAPPTKEQREAFKEKLESMGAVIYGGRK